jgi:alpha-tubulin suppressor-like RCC1 family protein
MANYNSLKNAGIAKPTGNISLGSDSSRYTDIFLSGNVNIAGTSLTSTNAIAPRIASIAYLGNDTAADIAGGTTVTLTGSGFQSGAAVYVSGTIASLVVVVSSTQLTFTAPVKAAGNYSLSVVNSDGATATFIPGIQYSGVPTWSTTAGSLATVYETFAISNTLSATSDSTVTYSVTSGSLPAGGSLNSSTGALTGTASSVGSSTTYNFTVRASDGENQDTDRNFSYTINPDVVTWSSPAAGATLTAQTGIAYTQALSATSAAGKSITYSANALPAGLSISGSSITGTPSAASSIASLITATAATTNKTATRTFNWNIPLAPTYTLTPASSSVNEGSALTFNVGGTNITNGTYYWSINNISTAAGDFSASTGSFTITSNAGSFTVTPTADTTTEGVQAFTVSLRTGSTSGTIVATSSTVTINDTSVSPINILYSWGFNEYGQQGVGDTTNRSSPVQISNTTTWSQISAGNLSGLSIKTDGTMWSWGYNGNGTLGLGDTLHRSSRVQIGAGTTWSKISANGASSLAIKTDGTLWAWGKNDKGQLGQGDTTNRSSPVQIGTLTNWLSISAGYYSSRAIKTDGTLWAWGRGDFGTLGLGNTTNISSPVQIGALTNWSSIAIGNYHNVAIKTDGTLWAWGLNSFGGAALLGLGNDTISRSSPTQVGALTNWSTLPENLKGTHCVAIKTDGTMWSWGYNNNGRLGRDGTGSSPLQIGELTNWLNIAAGYDFNIAVKTDGTIWSWGHNNHGQLGVTTALLAGELRLNYPAQIGASNTWLRAAAGRQFALAGTS